MEKNSKKSTIEEQLLQLQKQNKKLSKQLEKSKETIKELRKELKKNDAQKITITKEQEQLLLNLLKDINIQKLL